MMAPPLHLAKPASPTRFAVRSTPPRHPLRYRVSAAEVRDPGLEALLKDVSGWLGRQYRSEWGAGKAQWRAEARTDGFQKSPAVADIARDVFEVGLWDHPSSAVPVEYNQIELVELYIEQLTDRKRDQRQFADRRAVLLFGRPQDREMNEIDRWIGFEDVAPDALSGMRFARNKQHPQPITHAIHDDNRAIVVEGQLLRPRLDLDFDYVGPAIIDFDRHRDFSSVV